jgi:cytochrome c oxidase subunit IV
MTDVAHNTAHDTAHDTVHAADPHYPEPADPHEEHWSDLKYVKLAIALAVITAIEVWLSYAKDDLGAVFLPALLILMAVKFFSVVLFFMHLKFDNRLFSVMFYLGLGLAISVYVAALFTLHFFVK